MPKSFGCQFFFPLCVSLALAALLVSGNDTRTAQVAVVVRALLVYAYGLNRCRRLGCLQLKWCRRPYLLKRRLLKVVLRTAASVPQDNAQWADVIGLA